MRRAARGAEVVERAGEAFVDQNRDRGGAGTRIAARELGRVWAEPIDPLDLGIPRCDPEDLRGGSPDENARAIREIFSGRQGGARDAVVLNAAGALAAAGTTTTLREGLAVAREAIDSGAAGERLEQLIAFTREEALA